MRRGQEVRREGNEKGVLGDFRELRELSDLKEDRGSVVTTKPGRCGGNSSRRAMGLGGGSKTKNGKEKGQRIGRGKGLTGIREALRLGAVHL